MNHGLESSMFWVGAMFAFTPIVFFGIVIGVWWYTRRRDAEETSDTRPSRESEA